MARDMKVGLTFEAEDKASPVVRRITGDAARQAERTAQRSIRAATDAQRAQEQAATRQQTSQERATRAREQLGIRSERAIRREIQLTQAAYNRLAQTGRLSANEQARAYGQMQQRVASLRQEMAGLERQQRRGVGSTLMRAGSMVLQAGAPIAAAGAIIGRPVGRTMDYDQRLRYMANTAFGDNGAQGREHGYQALKAAVNSTVTKVGGTRDEAAGALSNLLNAGVVGGDNAMKLLPTVQKVAVGSDANADDVASLVNSLVKTGGIAVDEVPQALNMFVKAAKEGAIEFKDLARGMPQILAAAQANGISGLSELPNLLVTVEDSMATAGSPDQAMNNVFNWLGKMNSQDSIRAASKIKWAPGKSIDLVGQLAEYRSQGMNQFEAYDKIVNRIVAADPNITRIEKQLHQANPQDRQKILESQYSLFEGSSISQLLPDRQGLMGYLSYRYSAKGRNERVGNVANSLGASDEDWAFIAAGPSFKAQQGTNQWQIAEFEAFKGLANTVGDLSGKMATLAAEYPTMAQTVVAVTTALTTLAAVAGSAALLSALRGRGAGAAGAGAAEAAAGGLAAERAAASGGSKILRGVGRVGVAGPLVAAGAAYGAYQVASDDTLSSDQKTDQYIGLGARTGGAWAGMRAGAVAGSAFGPWGTLIGGVAGGFAGDYLGDGLAKYIEHLRGTSADNMAPPAAPGRAAILGLTPDQVREAIVAGTREANQEPRKLDVDVTLDVRGGNITAEVNRVNERDARRH